MTAKKKEPTEKAIENAILTYLNYLPRCFAWKNNNTGVFDPRTGKFRANKNKFIHKGVPDIIGCYHGRLLLIEVKKKGGKLTKEQQLFLERNAKLGAIAGVARSVDEAREIIKGAGNGDTTKGVSE